MSPRSRKILSAIALVVFATQVRAADGPECFSKYTKMNICQYAREAQQKMAENLPMKINQNLTMSTVIAVGPRMVMTANFQMTEAQAQEFARSRGFSMEKWSERIDDATRNTVCASEQLKAFVGLGGQIQYVYRTLDGQQIFAPKVSSCNPT